MCLQNLQNHIETLRYYSDKSIVKYCILIYVILIQYSSLKRLIWAMIAVYHTIFNMQHKTKGMLLSLHILHWVQQVKLQMHAILILQIY